MSVTPTADSLDQRVRAEAALRSVLNAAWMAVGAGILVQMGVVFVRSSAGQALAPPAFFAELFQGVSWSVLVCAALAVGTLAAKARPVSVGLIGLIAGPLAWAAAKGVQKGVQALAGAPQDQLTPLFWTICLLKGFEYAALGASVSHMVRENESHLTKHILVGLIIGVIGASFVLNLHHANAIASGAALPLAKSISIGTNEVLFPIACSVVIYLANRLNQHVGVLKAAPS